MTFFFFFQGDQVPDQDHQRLGALQAGQLPQPIPVPEGEEHLIGQAHAVHREEVLGQQRSHVPVPQYNSLHL